METQEAARLRKVLSADKTARGCLEKSDKSWTESDDEAINLLLETHFPGCDNVDDGRVDHEARETPWTLDDSVNISEIVKKEKVEWAVNSFDPYKSGGKDGIIPAMIQKASGSVVPWLVILFKSCLLENYIPKAWREVRVTFIPKAGKSGHSHPKDYRPISLTSFLLKTLERLIDLKIRGSTGFNRLCKAQHAYCKGRSVESALHEVVNTVEKTLQIKEYTMATFMDIEGAFNNLECKSIQRALEKFNVETAISRWINQMLRSRMIESTWGEATGRKNVSRGTPQGGVLSPLLWIICLDELLTELKQKRIKVTAYADDVVILVTGKFPSTLGELTENAMNIVTRWTTQNGLSINPNKTDLVLFTRRRIIRDLVIPKVNGIELKLSTDAKYLGVILDSKMNWKRNTEERTKKATNAMYACRRMFGNRWGLQPYIVNWMYTAIVQPILTYGCVVWWEAVEKRNQLQSLTKIQRMACIGTTGALRSTPTAGMEMILHLLPLDVTIKNNAAKSAIRLKNQDTWKETTYGHGKIIRHFKGLKIPESFDNIIKRNNFESLKIQIPDRKSWNSNSIIQRNGIPIFTDGSKTGTGVGSGVYSEVLGIQKSYRLPNDCSVFQAEILAIKKAAELILGKEIPYNKVTLYVDSQAAIKALASYEVNSRLVLECREALKKIETKCSVQICWVPGHKGYEGNEKADKLAKQGSELQEELSERGIYPSIQTAKRILTENAENITNKSWETLNSCKITRQLWPRLNKKNTQLTLNLDRNSIRILVGVITGHCGIGIMAKRLGIPANDYCRSCNDEEEIESITHLLCECPAIQERRLSTMGARFFENLGEVEKVGPMHILNFIRKTSWFTN